MVVCPAPVSPSADTVRSGGYGPELLSAAVRGFATYEYVRVTSAPELLSAVAWGEREECRPGAVSWAYNAEGIGTFVRGYNNAFFYPQSPLQLSKTGAGARVYIVEGWSGTLLGECVGREVAVSLFVRCQSLVLQHSNQYSRAFVNNISTFERECLKKCS